MHVISFAMLQTPHYNHRSSCYRGTRVSVCMVRVHYLRIRSRCFITDFISGLHQTHEHVFMLTQMICAWFIRHYDIYLFFFSRYQREKVKLLREGPPRYLSLPRLFFFFLSRAFTFSQLSLRAIWNQSLLQRSFTWHVAKWEDSQKRDAGRHRERGRERGERDGGMCAALSVQVIVELAPGPPHPSEVGVKMREWDGGLGSGSRVLALHPITSDG